MNDQDNELAAISAVVAAFSGLDQEAQTRVLEYVCKRYQIGGVALEPRVVQPSTTVTSERGSNEVSHPQQERASKLTDIKSLKEAKQPNSSIQMAVLVAYYMKSEAPAEERRDTIGTSDIAKYFTQAQYKLPTGKNGAADTLNNARRAGYFDSAGQGTYKLNAVGFNLAAYNMPTGPKNSGKSPKTKKRTKAS